MRRWWLAGAISHVHCDEHGMAWHGFNIVDSVPDPLASITRQLPQLLNQELDRVRLSNAEALSAVPACPPDGRSHFELHWSKPNTHVIVSAIAQ